MLRSLNLSTQTSFNIDISLGLNVRSRRERTRGTCIYTVVICRGGIIQNTEVWSYVPATRTPGAHDHYFVTSPSLPGLPFFVRVTLKSGCGLGTRQPSRYRNTIRYVLPRFELTRTIPQLFLKTLYT